MKDEQTRQTVAQFLRACVTYAEDSIERKRARGDSEEVITPWLTYAAFTRHSIIEVESGSLDHWLAAMHNPTFRPTPSSKDSVKGHDEIVEIMVGPASVSQALRSTPVYLVGTTHEEVANVSAITSIMPVSLSPPLLAMSIGCREGEHTRDTIRNAERGSTVRIMRLPSTLAACEDILTAAEPLPPEHSEWVEMKVEPRDLSGEAIHPHATDIIDCVVKEILALPQRSARLVLLEPTNIWGVPKMRDDPGPLVEGNSIRLRPSQAGEIQCRNDDMEG